MSDDLKHQLFQAQARERNARRALLQRDIDLSEKDAEIAQWMSTAAALSKRVAELEIQLIDAQST